MPETKCTSVAVKKSGKVITKVATIDNGIEGKSGRKGEIERNNTNGL